MISDEYAWPHRRQAGSHRVQQRCAHCRSWLAGDEAGWALCYLSAMAKALMDDAELGMGH